MLHLNDSRDLHTIPKCSSCAYFSCDTVSLKNLCYEWNFTLRSMETLLQGWGGKTGTHSAIWCVPTGRVVGEGGGSSIRADNILFPHMGYHDYTIGCQGNGDPWGVILLKQHNLWALGWVRNVTYWRSGWGGGWVMVWWGVSFEGWREILGEIWVWDGGWITGGDRCELKELVVQD